VAALEAAPAPQGEKRAMKAIATRVDKLETRFAAWADKDRSPADILRERRCRHLAAGEREPERHRPRVNISDSRNSRQTFVEALQRRRNHLAREGGGFELEQDSGR
jgi:hypothetical protein